MDTRCLILDYRVLEEYFYILALSHVHVLVLDFLSIDSA